VKQPTAVDMIWITETPFVVGYTHSNCT